MHRWSVVIGTPDSTWAFELHAGRTTIVGDAPGAGLHVAGAGLADRHVSLVPREEGVLVEPLREGGEVTVNDVPTSAQVVVRPGDELRLARARLIFVRTPPTAPARPRVVSEDEFSRRLDEEVRRGHGLRPLGVVLVASPRLNVAARQALSKRVLDEVQRSTSIAWVSELATEVMAVVLPELEPEVLSTLLARLPEVAGPRAVVTHARAPLDGVDAEALLGRCWDALAGDSVDADPVVVDPAMIRLVSLTDTLVDLGLPVCAVGPPGSGRATLLEGLARAAGRRVSVLNAGSLGSEPPRLRAGDWVLVRDVDRLPAASLEMLSALPRTRLLGTATHAPTGKVFRHVLEVPSLAARRDEVLPLAESIVGRARAALGRPRLTLSPEAKAMLQGWSWPGNVRELVNVLFRAARVTVRDEIGRDALPARLSLDAPSEDFRGALRDAERELLLGTLGRSRWNVTAAATRLGMPRRTLVHRLKTLGLKRPAR